ncbi:hypothetical protein H696_01968 [Fonticula alba]|uniref:Uncharacterized protein n=1 Tax=Fonticula alba TaxID=691883 RepID=A0A058ZC58_FONAL|nr:hypothetical protein H696_01968 [Fonticula alba]KCV71022.1 hypothetical protein H696_01968 [Fonticula alba]|eukprot:XP_009494145.1 hypothetical protein H696_01968 [Fonticula alba]
MSRCSSRRKIARGHGLERGSHGSEVAAAAAASAAAVVPTASRRPGLAPLRPHVPMLP